LAFLMPLSSQPERQSIENCPMEHAEELIDNERNGVHDCQTFLKGIRCTDTSSHQVLGCPVPSFDTVLHDWPPSFWIAVNTLRAAQLACIVDHDCRPILWFASITSALIRAELPERCEHTHQAIARGTLPSAR
jgi:hypothetical protein